MCGGRQGIARHLGCRNRVGMGGGRAGGASKDETKVTKMDLWDLLLPSSSMAMFQFGGAFLERVEDRNRCGTMIEE